MPTSYTSDATIKSDVDVEMTKPPPPSSSRKLFFVPKGTDFGQRRREILANNLQQMGCTFVGNILEADYIVVSTSIVSMDRIAQACKLKSKRLENHIRNQQIPLIVPRWADDCISQQQLQLPPGRRYAWPHFASISRSRSDSSDAERQAKRAKSDPIAPPATSSRKRHFFRKNLQCADIFKRLSVLYKEMQLPSHGGEY